MAVSYQTSTSANAPWGPQQDYLKNIWGQAEQLYQQPGPDYYSGQTYAPFAPETEQSLAMRTSRAQMGSPLTQGAKNWTLNTMQGGATNPYMGGLSATASGAGTNPYLDAMYDAAARPVVKNFTNAVAPSIAARFVKSGRYGSGAMKDSMIDATDTLGQNLAGMAAGLYGSGFEAERGRQYGAQGQMAGIGENFLGRQQAAAQMAPNLAMSDYTDIDQLGQVGQAREGLGQQQITDAMNRWNYNQQLPANKLRDFLQFVQGNYGGTSTTSQPIYRNQASSALGGALAGGSLFGPIGAIGGGLMGMFA